MITAAPIQEHQPRATDLEQRGHREKLAQQGISGAQSAVPNSVLELTAEPPSPRLLHNICQDCVP
ncbi:hypothetical protein [Allokutzneria oryzae]|uniref:Uncharacterized protein n=1 Tax=Allokutzneria oryzae TaxID=1378989 RepID=A0ABV6A5L4_9PSEU